MSRLPYFFALNEMVQKNLDRNIVPEYCFCMKSNGAYKINLLAVATITAGHPFRERINPTEGAQNVVVQMRDTSSKGVNWETCVRTEISGRRMPNWLQPGDIIFPARGNISRAILIDEHIGSLRAVVAPHFFILRLKSRYVLPAYLAWWLNQEPAQRHLDQNAQSSTLVRNIARPVLENMPIMVPPPSRQRQITDVAFAMEQEESLLQQLRQTNQQIMTGLARDLLPS